MSKKFAKNLFDAVGERLRLENDYLNFRQTWVTESVWCGAAGALGRKYGFIQLL